MLAPDFWDRNDAWSRIKTRALAPIGLIYGATVRWKADRATPYRAPVPVVCVGNITAGGTGKTPIAIAIARALITRGRRPFFLTRGYGGGATVPVLVDGHRVREVGDEPLLLARVAPTVVSRQRAAGAKLAVERGADTIVMDDGHQNFSLAKDLSLVVVDAQYGFGNRHVLPAGPLREPVGPGLRRADAVVLAGDGSPSLGDYRGPVLCAQLRITGRSFAGKRVIAFAGIGRPAKFFDTLRTDGAEVVAALPFADHYRYTEDDVRQLADRARDQNAQLVTTEKDVVRIPDALRTGIAVLSVDAVLTPAVEYERLLDRLCAAR